MTIQSHLLASQVLARAMAASDDIIAAELAGYLETCYRGLKRLHEGMGDEFVKLPEFEV